MTNVEALEDDRPRPQLKLLRGGKGPPSDNTPVDNWLSSLSIGAVFTCRKKGQSENYVLMMLQIVFKHDKSIIVADAIGNNPYAAIDPVEFCKRHELFEIIQQGEADNAHDLRTIRSSGMAHDADAQGGQPTDVET